MASGCLNILPMPDDSWKRLEEIVGAAHLTHDTGCLRQRGWDGPSPQAILRPGNREQVCEVLRLAHAEGLRVAPAGNCTKQRLGGIPRAIDLLLWLDRMNRITEYQAADLTITVEAGVRIEDLAAALRAEGQMLPLDVPFGSEATIGGVIATNGSGPRRLAYGSARDMVLGVHFVTAEGTLAKSGGKVVKNVAGYDLGKLLIGSLGTLAVLTDITFKVLPIPPSSATLVLGFSTAAEALQARNRILNSPVAPQALDLLDSPAGALLQETQLSESPFALVVAVAGPEAVVSRASRELPLLVRQENPVAIVCLMGEAESKLWSKIQEFTPAFLRAHSAGVVIKASVVLTQVGQVIEQARRAASQNGLALAVVARAGTGIVYCYLWPESSADDVSSAERMASACGFLLNENERLGGRAIVEWSPLSVKEKVNIWGTLQDDFALMQRLKAQMDPRGILNPGRYYGGI